MQWHFIQMFIMTIYFSINITAGNSTSKTIQDLNPVVTVHNSSNSKSKIAPPNSGDIFYNRGLKELRNALKSTQRLPIAQGIKDLQEAAVKYKDPRAHYILQELHNEGIIILPEKVVNAGKSINISQPNRLIEMLVQNMILTAEKIRNGEHAFASPPKIEITVVE